jgi:hypothetical protein
MMMAIEAVATVWLDFSTHLFILTATLGVTETQAP